MARTLALRQYLDLPFHPEGEFDHGDVYLPNGHVYIANTAAGTVEVVDGERLCHLATIPDCPEASGMLAAQDNALIFAAMRGAGMHLVIICSLPMCRTTPHGSLIPCSARSLRQHRCQVGRAGQSTTRQETDFSSIFANRQL